MPLGRAAGPYLVSLDQAGRLPDAEVGAKARRLGVLLDDGFPVPDGVVLPVSAYRITSARAPVVAAIAAARAGLDRDAAGVAEAFASVPLPTEVETAVRLGAGALLRDGGATLAVRSSAVWEDVEGQSGAGQLETVLGVEDVGEAVRAVRQVWASSWRTAARSYRQVRGADPGTADDPGVAVIIQREVLARIGGALFTVDPVTGDRDRFVIEAVTGSPAGLLSGRRTPHRYVVDAPSGAFLVLPSDGPLSAEHLASLVELARRIRVGARGIPQDVEWTIADGRLWVLQGRPVTALPPLPNTPPIDRWVGANSQEVLPGPVTPLTWTLFLPSIEAGRQDALRVLGLPDPAPGMGYLRLIEGRPYFNATYFRAFFAALPGCSEEICDALIFGRPTPGPVQFMVPTWRLRYFRMLGLVVRHRIGAARRLAAMAGELRKRCRTLGAVHPADLDPGALAAHLAAVEESMVGGLRAHVLGTALAGGHFIVASNLLARWLPDEEPGLSARLITGGPVVSTGIHAALWRLARLAEGLEGVRALIEEVESGPGFLRALRALPVGEAGPFRDAFEEFLGEHGHRTSQEAELARPRWSEDPWDLVQAIARHLRFPEEDPVSVAERREMGRRQRLGEVVRRAGAWRGAILFLVLRWARRFMPFRENLKFEALRALALLRRDVLEVGRRLVARERLVAPGDVFFLERDELLAALLSPERSDGLLERVEARRHAHQRQVGSSPPGVVLGGGQVVPEITGRPETGVLGGMAASAGVGRGRVRHVRAGEIPRTWTHGEVLVAPYADPAWTPIFPHLAGIVLEAGGVLSHTAVVAREYGVPCVVAVPGASRRIPEGVMVTVDGDRGLVILPGEEASGEIRPRPGADRGLVGGGA